MNKNYAKYFFIFFMYALLQISLFAQSEIDDKNPTAISKNNSTQAVEGEIVFSDGTNNLLRITDEGTFGAIQFQDGIPDVTDFKLYRNGSDLYFNGSPLNGELSLFINDLDDAFSDVNNLFVGGGTGINNTTGQSNTAIGKNSFSQNTEGVNNIAIGYNTLNSSLDADGNIAIGNYALESHIENYGNVAVGYESLRENETGLKNIAVGNQSLLLNISGRENTAIGATALQDNVTANYNTAVGSGALINNEGSYNTALGKASMAYNSTGQYNVGIGIQANNYNQTGSRNTIIGYEAGFGPFEHSKSGNVFIGYQAGYNETNDNKLYINNDSSSDPLIYGDFEDGIEKLVFNGLVGIGNSTPSASLHVEAIDGVVFEGPTTGSIPVEGSGSRMMWYQGKSAFRAGNAQTQWDDVNIGSYSTALNYRTTASGTYSFASGYQTEASGQRSTATGSNTKAEGIHSTALGSNTEAKGDYSTTIGRYVRVAPTASGTIFIGDNSVSAFNTANTSNRFSARFDGGYRFFTKSDLSTGALMNNGDNSWSIVSDSTKKENFRLVDGEVVLDKISQFKLTSWNYKSQDPSRFRHYGPMAQEFYSAFGNDGIGTIGNDTTIASADFDGINLIAIQALEKRTSDQNATISKLESRISNLEQKNKTLAQLNSKFRNENSNLRQEIQQIKMILSKIQIQSNRNKIASTK